MEQWCLLARSREHVVLILKRKKFGGGFGGQLHYLTDLRHAHMQMNVSCADSQQPHFDDPPTVSAKLPSRCQNKSHCRAVRVIGRFC